LTNELKNKFWSNLKVTLKFVAIVIFGLSVKIIFDAFQEENNENLFFPLYFLAFIPVIILGVFTYTKLKLCSLNKYICSVIFGAVISISTIIMYVVGSTLDATDINMRLAQYFFVITFVTTTLIYLQLPWENDA
jgi:hypothetical protein